MTIISKRQSSFVELPTISLLDDDDTDYISAVSNRSNEHEEEDCNNDSTQLNLLLSSSADHQRPEDTIASRSSPAALSRTSLMIIAVEFCERFSFYGATLVLVPYLSQMLHFSSAQINTIMCGFGVLYSIFAVAGGILADAKFGQCFCILVGSSTYLVGLVVLTCSSAPFSYSSSWAAEGGLYLALTLMAIGTGLIKANVSTLVGNQVTDKNRNLGRVFRAFYVSINAGALLGMLICPLLHRFGPTITDSVGNEHGSSFWISFIIPTIVFVVGIAVFISGLPKYITANNTESANLLQNSFRIIKLALSKRTMRRINAHHLHWLDYAKSDDDDEDTNNLIEDLKQAARAGRVFLVFPMYWLLYNQMNANFIIQGEWMRPWLGLTSDQMSLADPLLLVLIIPRFDSFVFPALDRRGIHLGPLRRILIGLIISTLGFVCVSALQYAVVRDGHFEQLDQMNSGSYMYILDIPKEQQISLGFQLVPIALIAISELFTSVTALEYAYSKAPKRMKGIVMAVYILTTAASNLLGLAIAPWMQPNNMLAAFIGMTGSMFVFAIGFGYTFSDAIDHDASRTDYSPTPSSSSSSLMSMSLNSTDDVREKLVK